MKNKENKLFSSFLGLILIAALCIRLFFPANLSGIVYASDGTIGSDYESATIDNTEDSIEDSIEDTGEEDEPEFVRGTVGDDDEPYDPLSNHNVDDVFSPYEEVCLQVAIPMNINFYLDPLNLMGNGTIFSPEYTISNYSNVDVELIIRDLVYYLSESAGQKSLSMFLRHLDEQYEDFAITDKTDGEVLTIQLKAANYDENGEFISLNEDSIFRFTITGDVFYDEDNPWQSGDLHLVMAYYWTALIPDEIIENADLEIEDDDAIKKEQDDDLIEEGNEPFTDNGDSDDTDADDSSDTNNNFDINDDSGGNGTPDSNSSTSDSNDNGQSPDDSL